MAFYDLEVQVDGGEWQRVLTQTQSTGYQFTGALDHTYGFRVRAWDVAGNVGAWPVGADTVTRVVRRVVKYYYHGGARVALRTTGAGGSVVYWLHGDHLGSVSLVTDHASRVVAQQRFLPYGGVRYSEGTFPTDVGFTGHRGHPALGLIFMRARYYHVALGRFVSADTVVPEPGNPQSLNRFSYVLGNPLRYTDPTGHLTEEEIAQVLGFENVQQLYESELWKAWTDELTGDPYWLAVLAAVQSGDRLQASEMAGALLFQSVDGVMRAFAQAGARSVNLWDWQGQGFYTIDRPGASDREDAVFSDQIFSSVAEVSNALYGLYSIRQYRYDVDSAGRVAASFTGFQMLERYTTVQWTGLVNVVTGDRIGPGLDFTVDALLTVGGALSPAKFIALIGLGKLAVDLGATGYKTFADPVYRYEMTSSGTMPNPFW